MIGFVFSGPFKINACPLRRISQRYVIATQTKIDISGVKIDENINDEYFKRKREKRAKKEEGDVFQKKKEVSVFGLWFTLYCFWNKLILMKTLRTPYEFAMISLMMPD